MCGHIFGLWCVREFSVFVSDVESTERTRRPLSIAVEAAIQALGANKWELKRAVPILREEGDELMGGPT